MNKLENNRNIDRVSLASLFFSFFRLGVSSYGGAVMVAYIHKMVVEKKKWLEESTFRYGVAICQTIPGSTSMQAAAYAGLRLRGMQGAVVSYIGFGLPSFIIIMVLSALYLKFHLLPPMVALFSGLQAIIVAIMANATISYGRTALVNWRDIIITFIAAILFALGINPVLVIISATIICILIYLKKSMPVALDNIQGVPYSLKPVFFILGGLAIGLIVLFLIDKDLLNLSTLMLRISIFAFGGGYAAVPIMYHDVVDVQSWMNASTFLDGMVLGQATPGPVVITATFVGYILRGPLGGIIATICIFLPSFIILVCVVPYFDKLRRSPYFSKAIIGILCSFVGLLITVTMLFAYNINWDLWHILLAAAAFIALALKVDVLWVVLAGAVISVFLFSGAPLI